MQLAQVNVGRLRAPAESPEIAEFVEALDRINALADRSPGFLWRLSADTSGNLDPAGVADDPLLMINLSVWASYRHLHDYTYRTAHAHYLRRRLEWFERLGSAHDRALVGGRRRATHSHRGYVPARAAPPVRADAAGLHGADPVRRRRPPRDTRIPAERPHPSAFGVTRRVTLAA